MNILITGAKGQLGNEIINILKKGYSEIGKVNKEYLNADTYAVDVDDLDISDINAVVKFFNNKRFDLIINCAAYTNVDGCEENPDLAFKANALGARNLAMMADRNNAKLVHVSTDYVFSGEASKAYVEYDICEPKSIYGKTKLLGENYVRDFCKKYFIVRTSWLYGYTGNNFVKTIIKNAKQKGALKVVNDQIGNPTNANDLGHHILELVNTENYGIYHCTGTGECSWYDFAKKIVELSGINAKVAPCSTDEFPRPAKRPAYSSLDNMMLRSTTGDRMRDWQDAIRSYIKNLEYNV